MSNHGEHTRSYSRVEMLLLPETASQRFTRTVLWPFPFERGREDGFCFRCPLAPSGPESELASRARSSAAARGHLARCPLPSRQASCEGPPSLTCRTLAGRRGPAQRAVPGEPRRAPRDVLPLVGENREDSRLVTTVPGDAVRGSSGRQLPPRLLLGTVSTNAPGPRASRHRAQEPGGTGRRSGTWSERQGPGSSRITKRPAGLTTSCGFDFLKLTLLPRVSGGSRSRAAIKHWHRQRDPFPGSGPFGAGGAERLSVEPAACVPGPPPSVGPEARPPGSSAWLVCIKDAPPAEAPRRVPGGAPGSGSRGPARRPGAPPARGASTSGPGPGGGSRAPRGRRCPGPARSGNRWARGAAGGAARSARTRRTSARSGPRCWPPPPRS